MMIAAETVRRRAVGGGILAGMGLARQLMGITCFLAAAVFGL